MKVASLAALSSGRIYSPLLPEDTPGNHLCWRVSLPNGRSAAVKKNRTRDLPTCGEVAHPTAPPLNPTLSVSFCMCVTPIYEWRWYFLYMSLDSYRYADCILVRLVQ